MILIFHDNSASTSCFIKYLIEKSISYISLTPSEIVNEVSILDTLNQKGADCIWKYNDLEFNFKNISGLYNRLSCIDIQVFNDFIEEDRAYVQNEWWAYLVYRINNCKNSINQISMELMSGALYQFPFVYTMANSNGLKIPKYYISYCLEEIDMFASKLGRYIAKDTLYFDNNFR